jgi:hypothetical protein
MSDSLSIEWCVGNLKSFSNNAEFAILDQKSVFFVTPVCNITCEAVLAAGAIKVTRLLSEGERPSLNSLCDLIGEKDTERYDRIFLDMRLIDSSDFVRRLRLLLETLQSKLAVGGAVFLTLQIGQADRAFDVQNIGILSGGTWLPTRGYLYDIAFRNWAVRPLKFEPNVAPQSDLLLLRLAPKRPTLLIIYGQSMTGKTTLAREFTQLNPHMHLSNDFIYVQLLRALRNSGAEALHPAIVQHLGDGSGQACGNFNRALEAAPELLEAYLPHLIACIPSELNLVSIDLDFRLQETIAKLNELLTRRGFSVWSVQR